MPIVEEIPKLVTVFGGSGFIGRHTVRALAKRGYRVRVAVRRPDLANFIQPLGNVGQIQPVQANVRVRWSVDRAVEGADHVINLIGILHESGRQTFSAVQDFGARAVAEAARSAGARMTQISAIGADLDSASAYARSKAAGEAAVLETLPGATIFRPSIVFGPEDEFFNRFANMARFSPALPLIGGGHTRFQPVYVGDVADAVMAALTRDDVAGRTYELGGPKVYTFRALLEYILQVTGRRRALLTVGWGVAMFKGRMGELLPTPPITRDQVRLLRHDNVVAEGAAGLAELGLAPRAVEAIVPGYLARYRRPGLRRGTAPAR